MTIHPHNRRTAITSIFLCVLLASVSVAQRPTNKQPTGDKPAGDTRVDVGVTQQSDVLHQMNNALQALTARVSPAIVEVLVSGYGAVPNQDRSSAVIARQHSLGSGVVLDPNGYIMTNAHVIDGAQRVQVVLPQKQINPQLPSFGPSETYEAKVVGSDTVLDLALLKIEAKNLPYISPADFHRVKQGQLVVAIGSPQGLDNTVTHGIVSSVTRQADPERPMIYIQTDAPINPGNSGGALVDVDGHLVGINTFIYSQSGGSEGLGFAIPAPIIKFAFDSFRHKGHIDRPEIGIGAQPISPLMARALGLPRNWGVIITDVVPDSNAAKAGLRIGDIIVSVDEKPVGSLPMLQGSLYALSTDQSAKVEVLRGNEKVTLDVKIEQHKHGMDALTSSSQPQEALVPALGVYAIDVNEKVAASISSLRIPAGALVVARAAGPEPIETELQAGDIIHTLNRSQVRSVDELRGALSRLKSGDAVVMQVERDGGLQFVVAEVE